MDVGGQEAASGVDLDPDAGMATSGGANLASTPARPDWRTCLVATAVSDLPCDVRREGGQSLVIGGSSLVMLEGREGNPL